jgi:ureidoglycolate lyase
MRLHAQPLNAEAFAPFGKVVLLPQTAPTASGDGLDYWADVAIMPPVDGSVSIGYATVEPRPFVQTGAEAHLHTAECLLPVCGDMLVVVGLPPVGSPPETLPAPDLFAAFRVAQGEAVILNPGVWHWAPFPVADPIRLFILLRAGTAANDVIFKEFPPDALLELEL